MKQIEFDNFTNIPVIKNMTQNPVRNNVLVCSMILPTLNNKFIYVVRGSVSREMSLKRD